LTGAVDLGQIRRHPMARKYRGDITDSWSAPPIRPIDVLLGLVFVIAVGALIWVMSTSL
jgi:hypothetical protein